MERDEVTEPTVTKEIIAKAPNHIKSGSVVTAANSAVSIILTFL